MKNGKRKTTEGLELPYQEKIKTLGKKKEKLLVLGNSGSGQHQTSEDERKKKQKKLYLRWTRKLLETSSVAEILSKE